MSLGSFAVQSLDTAPRGYIVRNVFYIEMVDKVEMVDKMKSGRMG